MTFPWSFREYLCTSHLENSQYPSVMWQAVGPDKQHFGRKVEWSDMDLQLGEKWVQLCCSLCVYLANYLAFPCLKFSTNRMGTGAFSCAPGTLGDGKHQGVKNLGPPEWLLLLWAEVSNHMHRKHKLKPHPAALILLLKIGIFSSIIHLLAFIYLTSDGTSGFEMSSWLAPVKLSYHDLPLPVLEAPCVSWKINLFWRV